MVIKIKKHTKLFCKCKRFVFYLKLNVMVFTKTLARLRTACKYGRWLFVKQDTKRLHIVFLQIFLQIFLLYTLVPGTVC